MVSPETKAKLQSAFNTISAHLLKQNKKSQYYTNGEIKCAYRGLNGLKCAIGVLIPDEVYENHTHIEGLLCDSELVAHILDDVLGLKELPRYDRLWLLVKLRDLQGIHDSTEPCLWTKILSSFADTYNLEFNPTAEVPNS